MPVIYDDYRRCDRCGSSTFYCNETYKFSKFEDERDSKEEIMKHKSKEYHYFCNECKEELQI